MKKALIILAAACIVAVLIQLIPIHRDNPPVTGEIAAPAPVLNIIQRSCYDCHSNETTWPWYSRVAPVSWLVASDVSEGRDNMNFSTWKGLPKAKQEDLKNRIRLEVSEDDMPPFIYKLGHPDAKLSDSDKKSLLDWAASK